MTTERSSSGRCLFDLEILLVLEETRADVILSQHREIRPIRDQAVLLREREHSPKHRELRSVLEAQDALRKELTRRGIICRWVFHREGKAIRNLRMAWKVACNKAGCPGRIPHDLRRTAVRNFERAGVPRSIAMQITGHQTESVYQRYDIVDEADLVDGLGRLGRRGHTLGTPSPPEASSGRRPKSVSS